MLPPMATTPRPGLDDALRLGRRRFLAGERLDMSSLADELGVNRVTLHRWIRSRDKLLVEVVWSLTERTLAIAERDANGRGPEWVTQVLTDFMDMVITNSGMQRWLADEGEHAMRLLTRHETEFQPRLIAAVEEILCRDGDAGHPEAPVDLHELAFVIVRVIESYIYLDLITGEQPVASRAEPILRRLLG